MKAILIAACVALFATTTPLVAQNAVNTSAQAPTVQEQIRAMSGQLKGTYGELSQQLNLLNKEIGTATPTSAQTDYRTKLKTSLSQLEGMLTTVNTANEAAWPEIKAKAELLQTAAHDLIVARKEAKN